MPPVSKESKAQWAARGVVYDDRTDVDGPEGAVDGRLPWPKPPDDLDTRWAQGARGYLSVRDPFTGERHEIPTEYAPEAPFLPKTHAGLPVVPAPRWMIRRAMEQLPPKTRKQPPPHLDDAGPL